MTLSAIHGVDPSRAPALLQAPQLPDFWRRVALRS
jgi:hypothetical protein